jgi:hypothetical protein
MMHVGVPTVLVLGLGDSSEPLCSWPVLEPLYQSMIVSSLVCH